MFVGVNHSFAVPASECPGVEPDSIYFTEAKQCYRPPGLNVEERMYGGHDIGVFDYVNKTISPCYYPCDVLSFKKIAPPPMWPCDYQSIKRIVPPPVWFLPPAQV
ncbi:hypothetical protein PHJA_002514000 [Phtheirospermum japonicum]|uniref:KIB1-4 beta-propeller domain-containing protein n=1 Tax=Phtheirospermum japonicum TaxID=374723 RepID=A0A830DBM1_9LAMI|nr:hypothetical protein PHJA_002514000 [Phtheirospermum japonicum]